MSQEEVPGEDALQDLEARFQRSEALTAAILSSISAHIAVLDRTGTIIAVNDGWRRFAHAQSPAGGAPTYLGDNYLAVLANAQGDDAAEAPLAHAGIARVLRGDASDFSLEYPCFTPDAQLWFLMQVTPLNHPDGGVVVAHIDITARKNEELRKDQFIALAAHELKTPLTSLRLLAQLALRRSEKEGYTGLLPQLKLLGMQTETLAQLVTTLIDVSHMHSDQIELNRTRFDLGEVVAEAVARSAALSPERPFVQGPAATSHVSGDRDRISQVLWQLLANAITFSPATSGVFIEIVRGEGEVTVRVRDEGIGIDSSHHQQIFEPFFQVADFREKKAGMGVGLYLAQQIVKRHGGALWVESQLDAGSTFAFTLPLTK